MHYPYEQAPLSRRNYVATRFDPTWFSRTDSVPVAEAVSARRRST